MPAADPLVTSTVDTLSISPSLLSRSRNPTSLTIPLGRLVLRVHGAHEPSGLSLVDGGDRQILDSPSVSTTTE